MSNPNTDPTADLYEVRGDTLAPSDDPSKDLFFQARVLTNRAARLEKSLLARVPLQVYYHDVRLCLEAAEKMRLDMARILFGEGWHVEENDDDYVWVPLPGGRLTEKQEAEGAARFLQALQESPEGEPEPEKLP